MSNSTGVSKEETVTSDLQGLRVGTEAVFTVALLQWLVLGLLFVIPAFYCSCVLRDPHFKVVDLLLVPKFFIFLTAIFGSVIIERSWYRRPRYPIRFNYTYPFSFVDVWDYLRSFVFNPENAIWGPTDNCIHKHVHHGGVCGLGNHTQNILVGFCYHYKFPGMPLISLFIRFDIFLKYWETMRFGWTPPACLLGLSLLVEPKLFATKWESW